MGIGMTEKRNRTKTKGICFLLLLLGVICVVCVCLYNKKEKQRNLTDGTYQVAVKLQGGSGRASVTSPTTLTIANGQASLRVEWSSSHYDYMLVGEEKYLPLQGTENSVFEIPVKVLGEPFEVVADTTAMGTPHEIVYTLTVSLEDENLSEEGQAEKKQGQTGETILGTPGEKMPVDNPSVDRLLVDREIGASLSFVKREELQYAQNFAIDVYEGGYTLLTISEGGRFLLVPQEAEGKVLDGLDGDIVVLQKPVDHMYLAATATMDMVRAVDGMDAVRLSSLAQDDWYIPEAKEAMEQGAIVYAGKYSAPDYERLRSEHCRLAIENRMITHTPEIKEKLESLGIPVLVEQSSQEKEPLGRVEWVKLFGALLGKEAEAQVAFLRQQEAVQKVTDALQGLEPDTKPPTVAYFYITTNGAVSVRKANDYIPKMIALAGGRYVFDTLGDAQSGTSSVTMQMEEFYARAKDADYLIYNSSIDGRIETVEELLKKSALLKDFKAVKEGKVYCTTENLYQESMAAGNMIQDMNQMLMGQTENGIAPSQENQERRSFLYHVK